MSNAQSNVYFLRSHVKMLGGCNDNGESTSELGGEFLNVSLEVSILEGGLGRLESQSCVFW